MHNKVAIFWVKLVGRNTKKAWTYRVLALVALFSLVFQPIQPAPILISPAEAGGKCQLVITKTVDKATAVPGDILTYHITIRNSGTKNCTGGGVRLEDVVDSRLTFLNESHSSNIDPGYHGPLFDGVTLRWNANTLVPNESGWVEWTGQINDTQQCSTFDILNKARISASELNWQWVYSNQVTTQVTKSCTATLIVKKQVVDLDPAEPNKQAGDFTMQVTATNASPAQFPGSDSGTTVTLEAGQYSVDELDDLGYIKSFSGDCSGTIAVGETKTCTVVNTDPPPPPPDQATLIVIKHVVDQYQGGPDKTAGDFTMLVTAVNPSSDSFPGDESGTTVTVEPGQYSVNEVDDPGYDKSFAGDCNGTILANETKTCTVINTEKPTKGTLIVIKHVINDNGGSVAAPGFNINVSAGNGSFTDTLAGAEDPGVSMEVPPGDYVVTEDSVPGYQLESSDGCTGTIAAGETKTCTIVNNDVPQNAKLIVIKHVINDSGTGTKQAGDFTIHVQATNATPNDFAGAEAPGVEVLLDPGFYEVSEDLLSGYEMTGYENCQGNIGFMETKTCTITNNDLPPNKGVIVVKKQTDPELDPQVFNFTSDWASFSLSDGQENNSGPLDPGVYTVAEVVPQGWQQESATCDDGSPVSAIDLAADETVTCTFVNTKVPLGQTTLIVIKHVINDSGTGTKQAGDFTMNVTAQNPSQSTFAGAEAPGVSITVDPGDYNVDEADSFNYTKSRSASCSGVIAAGETKTCTITNDDTSGGGGCTGPNCGGGGGGCTGASCNPNPSPVNAAITCGPNATLSFTYGSDITGISIADNINFTSATSISPVANLPWTVPSGNGQTVYIKFQRATGSVEIRQATTTNCNPPGEVLSCTNLVTAEAELVTLPNQSVVNEARGKILIQTEAHGEVWYVHYTSGLKYYIPGSPNTMTVVRALAAGITNDNLYKIPLGLSQNIAGADTDSDNLPDIYEEAIGTSALTADTDSDGFTDYVELQNGYNPLADGKLDIDEDFANQQKGRFFLQTESAGQVWYVSVADGKRYYIPSDDVNAFNVIASLAQSMGNGEIRQIGVGHEINGLDTSSFATCYSPTPTVLGVADELPRTGFPFDLAQLIVIPGLAAYPWLRRRYSSALSGYFAKITE